MAIRDTVDVMFGRFEFFGWSYGIAEKRWDSGRWTENSWEKAVPDARGE